LSYDNKPMSMAVLGDVYNGLASGGFGLQLHRKLTPGHFVKPNNREKMRVKRYARIFSGSMVKMIDEVCNNPEVEIERCPAKTTEDRKEFYRPIRELVYILNRWLDLCNSRDVDGKHSYLVFVTRKNAEGIQNEFLNTLAWVERYREHSTNEHGVLDKDSFIPLELLSSMRSVCYGFAALIQKVVIEEGGKLLLKRFCQDIAEHHFAHTRASCGWHDQPDQAGCTTCSVTSAVKRRIALSDKTNFTIGEMEEWV